ncbi:MAG: DUF3299 domain-containing protein [Bacteroidetes bacterium]|nr:MAG: DUF3299 domain-containing protein [Bacteroidota bacterium]
MLGIPFAASQAQMRISWDQLADVTYSYEYSETFKTWYSKPTFGEEVKKLDGKEVVIKGYVLPMDVEGDYFILSQFPYSSCFFCGGAGQESVIELRFKKRKRAFKMDEFVAFKGTLRLNDVVFEMSYLLEDAEMVDMQAGE